MNIEFATYVALPCATRVFIINGIDADIDDFGSAQTHSYPDVFDGDLEIWGCPGREWHRNDGILAAACEKYHITTAECETICDMLETELSIGDCGWCI